MRKGEIGMYPKTFTDKAAAEIEISQMRGWTTVAVPVVDMFGDETGEYLVKCGEDTYLCDDGFVRQII